MSAIIGYAQAQAKASAADWEAFIADPNRWRLTVNGEDFPPGTDFTFSSKFGSVSSAVVMQSGKPAFDRPEYTEAAFVQAIVWGRKGDHVYIGMVEQYRPHADQPGSPGVDGHEPVLFMHCPMGFAEKAITGKFESAAEAAQRESGEEIGVRKVLNVYTVPFGHNPSPSFTPTWGGVVLVEVDLDAIRQPEQPLNEPIAGTYFVEVGELLQTLAHGKSPRGAYSGVSTSLSALMLFFATYPQYWPK